MTRGADCSGVYRSLPASAFEFEVSPELPPIYRIQTSGLFDEILENGITRDGPISGPYVDPNKLKSQLFPTLPFLRFLIGEMEGLPHRFSTELGFRLPCCAQDDNSFMSDILTNFPCETFGNAKDEIIRGLCCFLRRFLADVSEDYVHKLRRKY